MTVSGHNTSEVMIMERLAHLEVELNSFKADHKLQSQQVLNELKGINKRLDILNGQVAKNTAFRHEQKEKNVEQAYINKQLKFVAGFLFVALASVLLKILFG